MPSNKFRNTYPDLADKVVLSVDDNEMNQLVITKIMENAGMKTISAKNGAIAIQLLQDGLKPDFILMDLEMPVLNGLESSEWIKKNLRENIPIIINSGAVSALQKWKLKCIGINDYLEKPYSMHDIFDKLNKNVTVAHA